MANVFFKVRSRAKVIDPDSLLSIWARVRKGRAVDIRIPTGLHIIKKYWDSKKERPKDYTGTNEDMARSLSDIDNKLTSLRVRLYEGAMMHDIFTTDMARAIVESVVSRDKVTEDSLPRELDKYCRLVIEQMKSGVRTISTDGRSTVRGKGKRYAPSTIKSWVAFSNVLEGFIKGHPTAWDTVTETRLVEFKDYMSDCGYLPKTQNKYIRSFRAMASMAQDDGIHTMTDIYRSLTRADEKSSSAKTTKVYLTDAEIQSLYDMPLDRGSLKDQVRDVFCLGCYIGQRVSDYNHMSPEMFTKSAYGHDVIKLKQQKTGHEITIPVLNPHLMDIVKKYDYNMPSVDDVVLNRYIKVICQELAKTVPSLNDKVVSTLTLRDEKAEAKSLEAGNGPLFVRDAYGRAIRHKWELVCSHTARRSCITNLYLSDILSDQEIMHISGHEDYKTYKQYLCMSGDKIAEKIAQKVAEGKSTK